MSVAQELKLKRAELSERLEELSRLQSELQEQIRSVDAVITIYEPGYVAAGSRRSRSRKEDPVRDEVNALMNGVSPKQFVLEILRDSPSPLTASDCSTMIANRLGLADEDTKVPYITSRVAATLGNLAKRGRVRQAGMSDGRRPRWEVAI